MRTVIVIPTYNEADNIIKILDLIQSQNALIAEGAYKNNLVVAGCNNQVTTHGMWFSQP